MSLVLGYLLSATLLAGVLAQVPWADLGAALGLGPGTYDEAASASNHEYDAGAAVDAGTGTDSTADSTAGTETSAAEAERHTGPLNLRVAAWGQSYRVVDVARGDDGALVPPDDVATLGRWAEGAWPGDGRGTVVLVVHRDSSAQGRGPFAELEDLPVGSRVTLGDRTYRLEDVTTYRKDALPTQHVFGQGGSERLVIVTCGGSYSPVRGWDSNVVASWHPEGA